MGEGKTNGDRLRHYCGSGLRRECIMSGSLELAYLGINAPLLLSETTIVIVAPASVVLGSVEEFFGFCGILLLDGGVANFAQEEVFELVPIGFLAVEAEGVLAFVFEGGVVTPEVPVATFTGACFLGLALTHT